MMHIKLSILILIFTVTLISCKGNHEEEYHNIIDKIEAKSIDFKRDSTFSNNKFDASELINVTDTDPHFFIKNRKKNIESYACSECHTKPVSELKTEHLGKKAHWDIKLNHADKKTMNCLTCHTENDMDNLHSITGDKIDFNLSYQLCSQRHTKQVTEWKGGAHGKNLSGWKTSRVSKLCVECHNPHKPHFEKRWPARYNTKMVEERK